MSNDTALVLQNGLPHLFYLSRVDFSLYEELLCPLQIHLFEANKGGFHPHVIEYGLKLRSSVSSSLMRVFRQFQCLFHVAIFKKSLRITLELCHTQVYLAFLGHTIWKSTFIIYLDLSFYRNWNDAVNGCLR